MTNHVGNVMCLNQYNTHNLQINSEIKLHKHWASLLYQFLVLIKVLKNCWSYPST
jgi:hypothetical protein